MLFWKAFLFCLVSLVSLADFISLGLEIRLLREGPSVGFSQGCIPNGNLAQTGRTTRLVWARQARGICAQQRRPELPTMRATFAPGDEPPLPGHLFRPNERNEHTPKGRPFVVRTPQNALALASKLANSLTAVACARACHALAAPRQRVHSNKTPSRALAALRRIRCAPWAQPRPSGGKYAWCKPCA